MALQCPHQRQSRTDSSTRPGYTVGFLSLLRSASAGSVNRASVSVSSVRIASASPKNNRGSVFDRRRPDSVRLPPFASDGMRTDGELATTAGWSDAGEKLLVS